MKMVKINFICAKKAVKSKFFGCKNGKNNFSGCKMGKLNFLGIKIDFFCTKMISVDLSKSGLPDMLTLVSKTIFSFIVRSLVNI
jgi:hypothetical protein